MYSWAYISAVLFKFTYLCMYLFCAYVYGTIYVHACMYACALVYVYKSSLRTCTYACVHACACNQVLNPKYP